MKLNGKRYIICYNPEQARKDAEYWKAIFSSLEKKLKQGDKSLLGNKGYWKYLKSNKKDVMFKIHGSGNKKTELALIAVFCRNHITV